MTLRWRAAADDASLFPRALGEPHLRHFPHFFHTSTLCLPAFPLGAFQEPGGGLHGRDGSGAPGGLTRGRGKGGLQRLHFFFVRSEFMLLRQASARGFRPAGEDAADRVPPMTRRPGCSVSAPRWGLRRPVARSAAAAGQFLNGGGERPKTAVLLISVFAFSMRVPWGTLPTCHFWICRQEAGRGICFSGLEVEGPAGGPGHPAIIAGWGANFARVRRSAMRSAAGPQRARAPLGRVVLEGVRGKRVREFGSEKTRRGWCT